MNLIAENPKDPKESTPDTDLDDFVNYKTQEYRDANEGEEPPASLKAAGHYTLGLKLVQ